MSTSNPYLNQPVEVSIETFTLCNARCTFCPYPTLDRRNTMMPDALLERLLGEMQSFEYPFTFSPFKVNEPFLDARLIPYLISINKFVPLAQLRLFTNGSPLTQTLIHEIASLNYVEHLWISLNSHDAREYKEIMGLNFDHTARNLDNLHAAKTCGDFPHTVILSKVTSQLSSGVMGPEPAFVQYCAQRWPRFGVHIIKQDSWLGYVAPASPEIPDTPCARWFELSILSTGVVSLCCMDGKGEFPIGDINKQSMLDVYNNVHYRERRERLLSRRGIHPCSTCSY